MASGGITSTTWDLKELDNLPINKNNNLEHYLSDVYEKECKFTIEDQEVCFIQTGIETLVEKIGNKILEYNFMDSLKRCLVYNDLQYLDQASLIKVGSFYEGTKNGFPDEFDFILALNTIQTKTKGFLGYCLPVFYQNMRYCKTEIIHFLSLGKQKSTALCHYSESYGDVSFIEIIEQPEWESGPSVKLLFNYRRRTGEEFFIHTDLVPAIKVVHENPEYINNFCRLEPFFSEVITTGSYLYVNGNVSVTETEVRFVRHILSKEHFKAYRVLKYLINGYVDTDAGNFDKRKKFSLSSYKIKMAMTYHHYDCTNDLANGIGPCVLDVLDSLTNPNPPKIINSIDSQQLVGVWSDFFVEREGKYLKDMIKSLTKLQKSTVNYKYDHVRVKPVAERWFSKYKKHFNKRKK